MESCISDSVGDVLGSVFACTRYVRHRLNSRLRFSSRVGEVEAAIERYIEPWVYIGLEALLAIWIMCRILLVLTLSSSIFPLRFVRENRFFPTPGFDLG